MYRRVEVRRLVDEREHRGDRRLAVAARNRDDVMKARGKLSQSNAPLKLGNAVLAAVGAFGIVRLDRSGIDDQVRVLRLLGAVSVIDGDAVLFDAIGKLRVSAIASRHLMPLRL